MVLRLYTSEIASCQATFENKNCCPCLIKSCSSPLNFHSNLFVYSFFNKGCVKELTGAYETYQAFISCQNGFEAIFALINSSFLKSTYLKRLAYFVDCITENCQFGKLLAQTKQSSTCQLRVTSVPVKRTSNFVPEFFFPKERKKSLGTRLTNLGIRKNPRL